MDYTKFKPLLAVNADLDKLRFPLYLSPKIDGIRAVTLNRKLLSRKLKPIPNNFVRETLEAHAGLLEGSDGELVVGSPFGQGVFARTSSGIMSEEGTPDFKYLVFDHISDAPYHARLPNVMNYAKIGSVIPVLQTIVKTQEQLLQWEAKYVEEGYEGVMIRDPEGRYKFGRSTVNEGILLKVKRFEDDEALVIDFQEKFHNDNPAEKDELGNTKRSSHQENLRPAGTLGALIVSSPKFTQTFNIGTGFDDALRKEIWDNRPKYRGIPAKFKHQPVGQKDLPRFPVFLGFRDPRDL
jgi:DNA ligase-1